MTLPASCPEVEGVDAAGIIDLVDAMDADGGYQTLMIARHGKVIAQGAWTPYAVDRVHLLYSVSKSFTATVVGQLVDEGVLDLDRPVWSYLRDDWAGLAQPWPRVLVRHCLSMMVGHRVEAWGPDMWEAYAQPAGPADPDPFLARVLAKVPDGEPGRTWAYNQAATYLLAQVVQAVTGTLLTQQVRRRVLLPLGAAELRAQRTPQGRDLGYSGMCVTTPAILGLAQAYLDEGRVGGRQLLSPRWVDEARSPVAGSPTPSETGSRDWELGYGFSFWNASHGYRGDGAFGQFALVLPEQGLAVGITSEHDPMQDTLDLVWQHLLPACDRPGSAAADARLADRLAGLRIAAVGGTSGPAAATFRVATGSSVAGVGDRLTVTSLPDGFDLRLGDLELFAGVGRWAETELSYPEGSVPVIGSAGWLEGQFRAQLRLIETPHTIDVIGDPMTGEAVLDWRALPLTGPDPRHLIALP